MTALTTQLPPANGAAAPLVCIDRVEETHDATTFVFAAHATRPLDFKAGQFIVVGVDIADERLYRAYSLSSSPTWTEKLSITVKRVAGGRVSNHLLDHLRPGHAISALAPAGDFNIVDRPATGAIVLLSAGCGITPCLSIARWLLDTRAPVSIDFIHSARSGADVIMADELDRLDAEHANFRRQRVLEAPQRSDDLSGPLHRALFDELLPDLDGRTIFTCGPQPYMDAIRGYAEERGFDMDYFHCESFSAAAASASLATAATEAARYSLSVPAFERNAEISGEQTLLEALEQNGVPIVGACRAGVCGSCKCRVESGEVSSTSQATLSADNIAAGYVLACSSKARSDLIVSL